MPPALSAVLMQCCILTPVNKYKEIQRPNNQNVLHSRRNSVRGRPNSI